MPKKKLVNPTQIFISKLDSFLKYIPERFIKANIAPGFKSSSVEILTPDSGDSIKINSKSGLITVQYKDSFKKYACHFLNWSGQIEDAVRDIAFLIPRDKVQGKKTLRFNQYALLFCESKTGIILCSETMERHIGWGETYKIFDSKETAIRYAENISKDGNIECSLYNNAYEYLQTFN